MSYVPIVVTAPESPSPRARELADRLSRVILDCSIKCEVQQQLSGRVESSGP